MAPVWALLLVLVARAAARTQNEQPLASNSTGKPTNSWVNSYGLGAVERDLLFPVVLSGSMPNDYNHGLDFQGAWLEGKQGANRQRTSYAVLSRTLPAEPYWDQRVQLKALVSVRGVGGGAFAALFLRVIGGDRGPTLVFDNMNGRRITGWQAKEDWWSVVVDVQGPGPPVEVEGDSCPVEDFVPAFIQFGFLLCAGRGHVMVEQTSLYVVPKDVVRVTGGPPPWQAPGPDLL